MDETEITEMIFPTVIAGKSMEQPDLMVRVTDPHREREILEEHVERGDFQQIAHFFAENLVDPPAPFTFTKPREKVIADIARQSNDQFATKGWKKRVAIVGFADSKKDAPYDDPSCEIWGLNDLHNSIKRWTRWFDIHTPDNINEDVKLGRSPPDKCGIGGLARLTCPVYMQERNPDVPNSVKYPLEEILKTFSSYTGARYFTNSVSYMIAFALYEGIISGRQWDEIDIYGVDMAVGTEYEVQRASCEYWIGIAEGMGVKCRIPTASDLNKCTFLYGWETKQQDAWETKLREGISSMEQRLGQLNAAIEQNMRIKYQHEGAIGFGREALKIWSNLHSVELSKKFGG